MYLDEFISHNISIFSFSFSGIQIWEHYAFDGLSSCVDAFGWNQE